MRPPAPDFDTALCPAGTDFLASAVPRLLQGLIEAVSSSSSSGSGSGSGSSSGGSGGGSSSSQQAGGADQQAIRAMHGSAARATQCLVQWLSAGPKRGMLPAAPPAMELANLLINGPGAVEHCQSAPPRNCSCCLARSCSGRGTTRTGTAPVLALSGAGGLLLVGHVQTLPGFDCPMPRLSALLEHLAQLVTGTMQGSDGSDEDDQGVAANLRLLASKGGFLLFAQYFALRLAQARRARASAASARSKRAGRGSSGSSSSSGGDSGSAAACADLAAFLQGQEDSGLMAEVVRCWGRQRTEAEVLRAPAQIARCFCAYLDCLVTDSTPACPTCTPEQLLLAVEAAAGFPTQPGPGEDSNKADQHHQALMCNLLGTLSDQSKNAAWAPALMVRATPSLSAFVVAAAKQLRASECQGAAASTTIATWRSRLAGAVLHAGGMLTCPGGLLRPEAHEPAVLEQLLACAELALRCWARQPPPHPSIQPCAHVLPLHSVAFMLRVCCC